jgi:hypothetical protein
MQHYVIKFVSDLQWWFSRGTLVSSTSKTDHHFITEIVLKLVLNTITLTLTLYSVIRKYGLRIIIFCMSKQASSNKFMSRSRILILIIDSYNFMQFMEKMNTILLYRITFVF